MMHEGTIDWEARVGLEAEVTQLRRGDPDAMGALLERYQNRLYRYLLRMVREPATAEDLFQQTWLRVVQNIRRYDPRRNFEAWLFTLARNLAIDHLRRYCPESLDEPLPSGGVRIEQVPAEGTSAFHQVWTGERASRLAAVLSHLPAMYREVLTLRFEEDMRIDEIASLLDLPLSTAKTRLRRALESLRQKLETKSCAEDWE